MNLLLLVRIADGLVGIALFLAVLLQVVTVVPSCLPDWHAIMLSLAWAGASLWLVVYLRDPYALLDVLVRLAAALGLTMFVLLFEGNVLVLLTKLEDLFRMVTFQDAEPGVRSK